MFLATVFCWGAWALVLFFVNPKNAGWLGLLMFYLSMFLGLLGIFSIFGFVIRYLIKKQEFVYKQVKIAFRQGFMFALLLVGALFLQGERLLVWWNLALFIAVISVAEYFFIIKDTQLNH